MKTTCRFARVAALVLLGIAGTKPAAAQSLPPVSAERLSLVPDRVEAATVLGGHSAASGGIYSFRGDTPADFDMTKLGGSGDLTDPMPLGLGGLRWNPTFNGNIGYLTGEGTIRKSVLAGNKIDASLVAVEAGAGVRLWADEKLSFATGVSGIYGHTESTFHAQTAAGRQYVDAMRKAGWIDWTADTWSVVPDINAQYHLKLGRTDWTFNSTFTYYHTDSIENSSALVNVTGDSETWTNMVDVDIPLGRFIFGRELHTGGFFGRTEYFGNICSGLNTNYSYELNARLVLELPDRPVWLRWLGLGATYYWGEHFDGWTVGLEASFEL